MARLLDNLFERWGAVVARRRGRVLAAMALLALISLPFAYKTLSNLDANVFNQIDDSLKRSRYLREFSEDFGGEFLAAVIAISDEAAADPAKVDELRRFGEGLAKELSEAGTHAEDHALLEEPGTEPFRWIRQVEARAGAGLAKTLEKLAKANPQAVLSPDDVSRIKARFEPAALAERMATFRTEYAGAPDDVERQVLRSDPLGLARIARGAMEEKQKSRRTGLASVDEEGYFLSPDRTTLVVMARPVRIAQDLDFSSALIMACQRAENRAIEAFRKTNPLLTTALKGETYGEYLLADAAPQLTVGFTGLHTIAAENKLSLRWDILATTGTSIIAILLLFFFVFQRMRLAFDIAITMGLATLVTLAITGLTHGTLGVMGAGFTCILLGMGVDYGIHLYSTYHHLRSESRLTPERALPDTLKRCGPSILAASITTMVAFFGISTTHFTGLAELGLLSGIGLFVAAVLMLTLFPALLLRVNGEATQKVAAPIRRTTIILGNMHKRRNWNLAGTVCGVAVALGIVLLIVLGPEPKPDSVMGVRFDSEFSNLRSLRIRAFPLRERISERFGQGFTDVKIIVEGPDEDTAFAAAESVRDRAQTLVDKGELQAAGGILDFLPPPARQRETLDALHALDFDACRARFLKAAEVEFGDRATSAFAPFLEFFDEFAASVKDADVLRLANMQQGELAPLMALFARIDEPSDGHPGRVRLVMSYFPAQLMYPESWYESMAAQIEADPPPNSAVRLTAARMMGFELKGSLFRDMEWISAVVAICVTVLLLTTFRSPRRALMAGLPLIFGFLFILAGVMISQMIGARFAINYVNLMIFPVLLGSGIDYGVYLVFDAFSARRPGLYEIMSETGRGVLLCGLTTLAGFGSMVFGSFTGLIDFGWSAILGYSGALFGALIVLPSVMGVLGIGRDLPPGGIKK